MIYLILVILIGLTISQIYTFKLLKKTKVVTYKTVEKKLTDEQIKKQENLRKSFDNLMNYDYEEALKKE